MPRLTEYGRIEAARDAAQARGAGPYLTVEAEPEPAAYYGPATGYRWRIKLGDTFYQLEAGESWVDDVEIYDSLDRAKVIEYLTELREAAKSALAEVATKVLPDLERINKDRRRKRIEDEIARRERELDDLAIALPDELEAIQNLKAALRANERT